MEKYISLQTLKRLPTYLELLKIKRSSGVSTISSGTIAKELGLVEIQVRKDLACVSEGGRPRVGYILEDLIGDISHALGHDNTKDAVLIGAGKLGSALLSYEGFQKYGLNIVAAFDTDPAKQGVDESGKHILPLSEMIGLCLRMNIHIGIITVPSTHAQEICDMLVEAGVIAIWNFAPLPLKAPDHILIKNENMASSLAELSLHLNGYTRN